MNAAQGHITAAYAAVGGMGLIAFDWWGTIKSKIQAPAAGKQTASTSALSSGKINAFEAYIASYLIFMIIGESDDFGPVAAALAWAFATGFFIANFAALKQKFPELFSGGG